jgi:hypothetical protein
MSVDADRAWLLLLLMLLLLLLLLLLFLLFLLLLLLLVWLLLLLFAVVLFVVGFVYCDIMAVVFVVLPKPRLTAVISWLLFLLLLLLSPKPRLTAGFASPTGRPHSCPQLSHRALPRFHRHVQRVVSRGARPCGGVEGRVQGHVHEVVAMIFLLLLRLVKQEHFF